jgi:hypothetical protein
MVKLRNEKKQSEIITIGGMSLPAKVLASSIIFIMSFGMLGATGQIVVHDIIPTFFGGKNTAEMQDLAIDTDSAADMDSESGFMSERGDLFLELPAEAVTPEERPFYENEQFVWSLRWTHIHLFGIGMIFIFMGGISLLLDAGATFRAWLIVLPFISMLIDIAALWLKGFVSPVFFWLHLPGGGLFGLVFGYLSLRALWEMWIKPRP